MTLGIGDVFLGISSVGQRVCYVCHVPVIVLYLLQQLGGCWSCGLVGLVVVGEW